jgi:hypothetical protein
LRLLLIGKAAHDGARHAADGCANRATDNGATNGTRGRTGRSAAGLSKSANRGKGHKNGACKQDFLRHVSAPNW